MAFPIRLNNLVFTRVILDVVNGESQIVTYMTFETLIQLISFSIRIIQFL